MPIGPDPIYAAIERHKAVRAIWEAAVLVRARFPDEFTDAEGTAALDEAVDTAWDACNDAGTDLVTTDPTTFAGVIAALRYVRIQMRNDGEAMPHDMEFEFDSGCEGDDGETLGWIGAFLETIADATAALGKAVQA